MSAVSKKAPTGMPITMLLGGLFALVLAGRVGDALAQIESGAFVTSPAASPRDADETFAELDAWAADLEEQERALVAERARTAELAASTEASATHLQTLQQGRGEREERAARLAALYSAMSPEKAAAALRHLPAEDAAMIIGRMVPEAAGPILSALPTDTAAELSLALVSAP